MASSSQLWTYHVFLSFRGEDTRKNFVDHLYTNLVQKGINTYKDDEALPRGESIGSALLKAIQESRIAVIIFSENYANSSWCLDELDFIMKCRDERGQIVIPVFYHVDPSDIRKQNGKYGEAFAKYELENNKKIASWRKALLDAGNLSGWVPAETANGHESKLIEEIIKEIADRLCPLISSANEQLIGMETRVQDFKSKLEIGSDGVLMVGIWGLGGSGKTTLASSVYDDISEKFDGCCFLENTREKSSKDGLEKLQEKIIYGVLNHKKVRIERVDKGRSLIKSHLCHRKVLIVLDDVDDRRQLEALVGSHDWFGRGSRIMITTRNENLLNAHKVNVIHHVSLLNNDEAIKLFCKRAPWNNRTNLQDYETLSRSVVSYARGLPLALIVLGSLLCDKDTNEWRNTLARLKELQNDDIMEILKISYDGLEQVEKKLFLDIACFFRGRYKNSAMEIFDACGLYPIIGVRVLIQKALITVSEGCFDMHDLIQKMGHFIVKGDLDTPENHSRVWEADDVRKIWAGATQEIDKIEAIRIDSYMFNSLQHYNHHVVVNMKKLRWIDWGIRNVSSLPTNFPPGELSCLILTGGLQRRLWKGCKWLPNLRMIKLHIFENLITTPDFGGLPNLEKVMLNDCPQLEEIHPSIGRLERLVYLSVEYCDNFKMFPPMNLIEKLETLTISSCKKLSKSGKKVASFDQYCTNISVTCLPCFGNEYDDQQSEPFLLHNGLNHTGLQFISSGLRKLILRQCQLGDENINSDVWDLPNLQELDLSVNMFSRLSFCTLKLPGLKWLDVAECKSLVELSGLPSSIATLRADWCDSLENLEDVSHCKWLWNVSFFGRNSGLSLDDGNDLLDSMLQGNSIKDHFINFTHSARHHIPRRFVDKLVRGKTFKLLLPNNWYNDYSGFLVCNVNNYYALSFTISIKQELVDKDSQREVRPESNEEVPESYFNSTYVGYVSFSTLVRQGARLNSAYNVISFSVDKKYETSYEGESRFVAELVPKEGKDDQVQTTKAAADCSAFYDEEREYGKTFTIQRQSDSSIKILWRPCYWY